MFSGWIAEKARQALWAPIYDFTIEVLNEAFKMITNFIIMDTDIDKYVNVNRYMKYIYITAGSLLAVIIIWDIIKQMSGNVLNTEEKSLSTLILRTLWAASFIYFLPFSLINFILPINNYAVQFLQDYGITYSLDNVAKTIIGAIQDVNTVHLTSSLILGISCLILGIVAGIRYVEIVISYITAPFVAISMINNGEAVSIWFRETISIVFTQTIHVFLLQFLLSLILVKSFFAIWLAIGIVVVMVRGPAILRKYLYRTGTGSATVAAAGSASRMAAMRMMLKL